MFDVGWSELLVVGVVALVVVGPKDLPKLMRTAGQWAGRARAMADQFKRSFDDMARQAELDELRAQVERMKSDEIFSDIAKQAIMPPELNAAVSEVQQATMLPPGALNFSDLTPPGALPPQPVPEPLASPVAAEPAPTVAAEPVTPSSPAEPAPALPADGAVIPPPP